MIITEIWNDGTWRQLVLIDSASRHVLGGVIQTDRSPRIIEALDRCDRACLSGAANRSLPCNNPGVRPSRSFIIPSKWRARRRGFVEQWRLAQSLERRLTCAGLRPDNSAPRGYLRSRCRTRLQSPGITTRAGTGCVPDHRIYGSGQYCGSLSQVAARRQNGVSRLLHDIVKTGNHEQISAPRRGDSWISRGEKAPASA